MVQTAWYGTVSSALHNVLRKSFDDPAKIIGLRNKVKRSLPKSRNFNDCDSFKETDLLTDKLENDMSPIFLMQKKKTTPRRWHHQMTKVYLKKLV